MRTYGVSPSVAVPHYPLYLLGRLGLGQTSTAATAVSSAAKPAGQAVTSAIQSTADSGSTLASVAGPIGAAVSIGLGVVTSLLAAHEKRLQDAKNENEAAAQAVPSFYSTLQQIVQLYNSGQLDQSDTISSLQQLLEVTQQGLMAQVGPTGTAWQSSQPGVCNSSCTVGCCLYNTYLAPDINGYGQVKGVIPVIEAGGGQVEVGNIPSNSYGFPSYGGVTLTIASPEENEQASTTTNPLAALTGGGSDWLLWAGAAVVGFFLISQMGKS
jgi:hypothetical protein